jgi:hypothetical protein
MSPTGPTGSGTGCAASPNHAALERAHEQAFAETSHAGASP